MERQKEEEPSQWVALWVPCGQQNTPLSGVMCSKKIYEIWNEEGQKIHLEMIQFFFPEKQYLFSPPKKQWFKQNLTKLKFLRKNRYPHEHFS